MTFMKTFLGAGTIRHANALHATPATATGLAEAGNPNWVATTATAIPAQTAANSAATPFNTYDQATSSAWAFGNRMNPGATGGTVAPAAYYTITPNATTVGANGHLVSIFVKRPTTDPASTFSFDFRNDTTGGGTAGGHAVEMTWDATQGRNGDGKWVMTNATNGAVGKECEEVYADGWHRLQFFFQRRQNGVALELSVAANVLTFRISCEASKLLEAWGLLYESVASVALGNQPDAVASEITVVSTDDAFDATTLKIPTGTVVTWTNSTGSNVTLTCTPASGLTMDFPDVTVASAGTFSWLFLYTGVYTITTDDNGSQVITVVEHTSRKAPVINLLNQLKPSPYLDGVMTTTDPGGPLHATPGVMRDSRTALFQVSMQPKASADAEVVLLSRSKSNAPWEVLATVVEGDTNSQGSKTNAVASWPEVRCCITAWTAGTFGAWLTE